MISILITSFKEPRTIGRTIESILNQKIKEKYELWVSAPDDKTLNVAREYKKKYRQIKLFKDKGNGKSSAINQILPRLKSRIIILTDGDVYLEKNSINFLLEKFKDKKTACVSGRPMSQNNRNNIFGFWSHLLLYAAHKLREKRNKEEKFLECSGYLWAFRNIIKNFPIDVAEDSIVPALLWEKGYKIAYAEKAIVYVKYPNNLKDTIEQRRRSMQAHEKLQNYVNFQKMKSLKNEILNSFILFSYPKNLKEFFWLFLLFPFRFYLWFLAYYKKFTKRNYSDNWKRVESTK